VAYRLLTGRFVLRYAESPGSGPTPDGDTLKFRPDDPALVEELGLASGVEPALSAQQRISLRLEAVDALELHFEGSRQEATLARAARDGLLAHLGFRGVVWDRARPAQAATADEMPGWVLADGVEQNGRLVAFAFPGPPPLADGSPVAVDETVFRASANLRMLAEGLVYPMLYTSLAGELRELCRAARPRHVAQAVPPPRPVLRRRARRSRRVPALAGRGPGGPGRRGPGPRHRPADAPPRDRRRRG
jgi:endonuclease YncB( thermonuclease family)